MIRKNCASQIKPTSYNYGIIIMLKIQCLTVLLYSVSYGQKFTYVAISYSILNFPKKCHWQFSISS